MASGGVCRARGSDVIDEPALVPALVVVILEIDVRSEDEGSLDVAGDRHRVLVPARGALQFLPSPESHRHAEVLVVVAVVEIEVSVEVILAGIRQVDQAPPREDGVLQPVEVDRSRHDLHVVVAEIVEAGAVVAVQAGVAVVAHDGTGVDIPVVVVIVIAPARDVRGRIQRIRVRRRQLGARRERDRREGDERQDGDRETETTL